MKRREFIQWTAAGSLTLMGLSGCGGNPAPKDAAVPAKPVDSPAKATASSAPPMVVVNGTDPNELMARGLQAMGGIGRFVRQGQTVVIKPNFSVPRTPEQAATTNPDMVAALVKHCLGAGAKTVKVIDNPFTNAQMCLENTGIRRAVEAQFPVKVKDVNTMMRRGKAKRLRTASYGRTSAWKRAVVTLEPGQTIEMA